MTDNVEGVVTPEIEHTHKATITIFSNGTNQEVAVRVVMDPDLDGKSIEEIGYLPASFQFLQEYMLPAIEQAYMDYEVTPMLEAEAPSNRIN